MLCNLAGRWMVVLGCAVASTAFAEDDKHFDAVIKRAQQLAAEAYTPQKRHYRRY